MNSVAMTLTIFLLGSLLCGATPADSRSLDDVVASGSIDVCVQEDNAPFSDQIKENGIFIDLGKMIAADLGVRLTTTWLFSAEYIRKTACDIVPAVAAIPADDPLKLTIPYMRVRTVLVSRNDARPLRSISDLRNDKIAVLANSYARHALNQEGLKLSVAFMENEEILDAIVKGDELAGVVTLPSLEWYLRQKNAPLRANFDPLGDAYDYKAAIGLRKADGRLVDKIDSVLRKAIADGSIKRIFASRGLEYEAPRP